MKKEELAKWLHDNYEAVAKEQDWNTQQSCKVEFNALPDANKRTMIEIADRLLNFNLLRLHFVDGRSEQLDEVVVMPSLPDGLDDNSNCDHNFRLGWIACWKALTGNEVQLVSIRKPQKL